MFKNRSLQVKVVKDPTTTFNENNMEKNLYAINDMIAQNAKPIALAASFVIGTKTLSEIVLHITKTRIK